MAKILIAFYSTYGTNHAIADAAAEAARAAGAEVRLRRFAETAPKEVVEGQDAWKAEAERQQEIEEISHDDMEWAEGIWISSPTRYGGAASQVRAFFDTLGPLWQQGKLMDKAVTASASAQNVNGGVEMTLHNIYTAVAHWGSIVVPAGYGGDVKFEDGGNPYGFSTTAGGIDETGRRSIAYQTERLVRFTDKIAG